MSTPMPLKNCKAVHSNIYLFTQVASADRINTLSRNVYFKALMQTVLEQRSIVSKNSSFFSQIRIMSHIFLGA